MWIFIVIVLATILLLGLAIIKYSSKWLMEGDPGNWTESQKGELLEYLERLHMTECSVVAGSDNSLQSVCVETAVPAMKNISRALVNGLSKRFTYEFVKYQIGYLSSGDKTHRAFNDAEKQVSSEDAAEFNKRMEVIADSLLLMKEMGKLGVKNPSESYRCIVSAYKNKKSTDDIDDKFRQSIAQKCFL